MDIEIFEGHYKDAFVF